MDKYQETSLLFFSGEENSWEYHLDFYCVAKVIKNQLESHTLNLDVWLIVDCPQNADICKFHTEHLSDIPHSQR